MIAGRHSFYSLIQGRFLTPVEWTICGAPRVAADRQMHRVGSLVDHPNISLVYVYDICICIIYIYIYWE